MPPRSPSQAGQAVAEAWWGEIRLHGGHVSSNRRAAGRSAAAARATWPLPPLRPGSRPGSAGCSPYRVELTRVRDPGR